MPALALIHRPENRLWTTFNSSREKRATPPVAIRRAGFNFGAPGDRFSEDGTLWLSVTSRKPENVELVLDKLDARELFDAVVTGMDVTRGEGWAFDTVVAAYATAEQEWRDDVYPWFGEVLELFFDGQPQTVAFDALVAAGALTYADGLRLRLLAPTSGSGMLSPLQMATAIQGNLAAVGIELEIETYEWNTYLAKVNSVTESDLRKAVIYGSVMASFNVEDFSLGRLKTLTSDEVEERFASFKQLTGF